MTPERFATAESSIPAARPARRVWLLLLTAAVLLVLAGAAPEAATRYAALVIDARTGAVLHARHANTPRYPASLTKIMTLYMVFDAVKRGRWTMNTRLKVSARAARQPQTRLRLRAGQTIRVRDAIQALIVRSANDVASVVAENMAGSEREFAKRMTRKARALGMTRTTFRNASGLPNRRQRSTARDMAKLGLAIQRDFPEFYHHFKARRFSFGGRTYRNHNKLLGRYRGTDGIKTGYTIASGFNLLASVKRNGHHLIGVVFGGRSGPRRDRHMMNLFNRSLRKAAVLARAKRPPLPQARPGGTQRYVAQASPPADKLGIAAAKALRRFDAQDGKPAAVDRRRDAVPAGKPADKLGIAAASALLRFDRQTAGTGKPAKVADRRQTSVTATQNRSGNLRNWGIQIGAYSSIRPARAAVKTARRHADGALNHGNISIERIRRDHGTVFRARIMGLREAEARTVCIILVAAHLPCVAVNGNVSLAAATTDR